MSRYDSNKRCTDAWLKYDYGRSWNERLDPNYYRLVDTNTEFFIGNQWKGLSKNNAMASLPKPVFNIVKRIGMLFVASLTSTATKISYEPLADKSDAPIETTSDGEESMRASEMATSECANLFEKLRMDYRIRDALTDGVITGDYCAHFYWDANAKPYGGAYSDYRGEIQMELVDGVNIMFGNPNDRFVEHQPYILVLGRDTVENLKAEFKQHHPGWAAYATDEIMPDADYQYQAGTGGKIELPPELGEDDKTGKALFMYYYTKRTKEVKLYNEDGTPKMEPILGDDGQPKQKKTKGGFPMLDVDGNPIYEEKQATEMRTTVWVSKHTKFATIFDEIDTGLTYYPIAWGNWEHQKNIYHGRALVTGIIPNQIYINSMFALIMRHQQMLGFPKVLYDGNVIGAWNNAVGQAIAVYDLPPDKRMSDLHSVIQPADMSTQIMRCIEMAMAFTKECLGATDAQMGNVRPDNTSAIIALQSSSQVPLENPQSCKYEWVEDIGRILLDMMGTYYGERPVVRHQTTMQTITDPVTGMPSEESKTTKVVEMYDFSKLKNLWLNVRADVGSSTYWSRIAVVQTLDNLKQSGIINVIQYLERMPDEYIPRKEELVAELRKQMEPKAQPPMQPQIGPDGMVVPPPQMEGPTGVAQANMDPNNAALVAGMPAQTQEAFNSMSGRVQKNLLRQARANQIL